MARPWIKVEPALLHHPKTRQLAKLWCCHPYQVVGFLVAMWGYCLEYQEDGNVDGLPPDALDEFAAPCLNGAPGDVRDALQQVGFVNADGRLHDWDEYTGSLVEARRKDRERKRLARELARPQAEYRVRRTGRGQSAERPRTSGPRVEQSRVEGFYPEAFQQAWAAYPGRAGGNPKRAAFKAWSARLKAGASPQEILAGVERYRRFCETTEKLGTEFVKQAVTFFRSDEHFRDPWLVPQATGDRRQPPPAYMTPAQFDVLERESDRRLADGGGSKSNRGSEVAP